MEDKLHMNRETILEAMKEQLGKRKFCAKFVPPSLKDSKAQRVDSCKPLIETVESDL